MSTEQNANTISLPEAVFHYTSLDTLLKIVSTKSIWCTAISYLNDKTERQYVLDAVEKRLPELMSEDPSIPREVATGAARVPSGIAFTSFAREPFVASFASRPDSLIHWRSYCPQESGVAIGFRTECLAGAEIDEKRAEGMVIPSSGFGRVSYTDTSKDAVLDSIIRYCVNLAEKTLERHSVAKREDLGKYFDWAVNTIACTSKHTSFEAESEYRLFLADIQYRENNLKFRTVRSSLVPYLPMRIPARFEITGKPEHDIKQWDAIATITLGPTPNMDLTHRAVSAFLALHGVQANLVRSEVPYRDW